MDLPREFVVLDTETTGSPPGARIVELGALHVRDGAIARAFESLVFPECPVPPAMTAIHGIADGDVAGAPAAAEVVPAFLAWLGPLPILAHNAPFDAGMLAGECARLGLGIPGNPLLCTLRAARLLLPGRSHSLEALVASLGLPAARHHRAMDDARHALDLFGWLRDRACGTEAAEAFRTGGTLRDRAPQSPRLARSHLFLRDAAAGGEAVDLTYLLATGRVAFVRVTPRFFYLQEGFGFMEGLCHRDRHCKTYRLDRILAARLQPGAEPVAVRRGGGGVSTPQGPFPGRSGLETAGAEPLY